MHNYKALGSLIVPLWHSAPFWPMICPDGERFASFIVDWMEIPTFKEASISGSCLKRVWKRKLELQDDCFKSPLPLSGIFLLYAFFWIGFFFLCTLGAVRPPVSTR